MTLFSIAYSFEYINKTFIIIYPIIHFLYYMYNTKYRNTVKHLLFARTLYSRKFAKTYRRENKVLANNF